LGALDVWNMQKSYDLTIECLQIIDQNRTREWRCRALVVFSGLVIEVLPLLCIPAFRKRKCVKIDKSWLDRTQS
jgi:hypothetical protein